MHKDVHPLAHNIEKPQVSTSRDWFSEMGVHSVGFYAAIKNGWCREHAYGAIQQLGKLLLLSTPPSPALT